MMYNLVIFLTSVFDHSLEVYLLMVRVIRQVFLFCAQNKGVSEKFVIQIKLRYGFLWRVRVSPKLGTKIYFHIHLSIAIIIFQLEYVLGTALFATRLIAGCLHFACITCIINTICKQNLNTLIFIYISSAVKNLFCMYCIE